MKVTSISEEKEIQEFVLMAKKDFEKNPEHYSFSYKAVDKGCLLAMRWGFEDNSILVLKLDDFFEPVVYRNIIERRIQ